MNDIQEDDAEVVYRSWRYRWALVTNTGGAPHQPSGTLRNRGRLREALRIHILTDEEAVAEVRAQIKVRDDLAPWWHHEENQPLPSWFGTD